MESGDEHLSLDEHLGDVQPKLDGILDSGLFSIGQAIDGSLRHVGGNVTNFLGGSLVHFEEDAGYLSTVVLHCLVLLLLQISEVGTDGFGCELFLVVLKEHVVDSLPLGKVQKGEVL